MLIEAIAPNRIDLAGGTLDLYPLYLFEEYGITVNVAINLGSWVKLQTRPDAEIHIFSEDTGARQSAKNLDELALGEELDLLARIVKFYKLKTGVDVSTRNKAPKGSGLGSSSSLLIALSGALCYLKNKAKPGEEIIDFGAQLEAQNLRVPTGKQDYYAALYGGVSGIWFRVEGNSREDLLPRAEDVKELERRLVLSFTGETRFSGTSNWNMMKMYIDDLGTAVKSMKKIRETALAMRECLLARDWKSLPKLIAEEWNNRRKLAEGVSTPRIEAIMSAAEKAGAQASKICGAGGGGCMVTVVGPDKRSAVEAALQSAGAELLPFQIDIAGLTITSSLRGLK